jgi:hypothetical protein
VSHRLFHCYNCVALICQDPGNNYYSFENKNKVRLHVFVLNVLLNVTCSHYLYSVFVCTNTWDSPLLCRCTASVRQHCHSPSLAYHHVPLNVASRAVPFNSFSGTVKCSRNFQNPGTPTFRFVCFSFRLMRSPRCLWAACPPPPLQMLKQLADVDVSLLG